MVPQMPLPHRFNYLQILVSMEGPGTKDPLFLYHKASKNIPTDKKEAQMVSRILNRTAIRRGYQYGGGTKGGKITEYTLRTPSLTSNGSANISIIILYLLWPYFKWTIRFKILVSNKALPMNSKSIKGLQCYSHCNVNPD